MVDLLSLFSIALVFVVGLPTGLLIIGRIAGFINSLSAKETRTEKPASALKGKALIVYEPGATKQAEKVGQEIGDLLLERGYEVTMAGIRARTAKDTSGYDLLIVGTPTYIGRPTGLVKKYIKNLRLTGSQTFGIYLIGTKGAPYVGFVPKQFLDALKKPLAASGAQVREMAFSGYKPFDHAEFVDRLIAPAPADPAPEAPAPTVV